MTEPKTPDEWARSLLAADWSAFLQGEKDDGYLLRILAYNFGRVKAQARVEVIEEILDGDIRALLSDPTSVREAISRAQEQTRHEVLEEILELFQKQGHLASICPRDCICQLVRDLLEDKTR